MRIFIEQTDERHKRQASPRTDLSRHRAPRVKEGVKSSNTFGAHPGAQGLSRMKREFHVRFLGGWGAVMRPGYPTRRRFVALALLKPNRITATDRAAPHRGSIHPDVDLVMLGCRAQDPCILG